MQRHLVIVHASSIDLLCWSVLPLSSGCARFEEWLGMLLYLLQPANVSWSRRVFDNSRSDDHPTVLPAMDVSGVDVVSVVAA
jgi:hypothetical protein